MSMANIPKSKRVIMDIVSYTCKSKTDNRKIPWSKSKMFTAKKKKLFHVMELWKIDVKRWTVGDKNKSPREMQIVVLYTPRK
jgi:hypothetical protein